MFQLSFLLLLFTLVSASGSTGTNPNQRVENALNALGDLFCTVLPTIIVAMIVLAAIVFAAGQMMGAETRARANVWATNILIGAGIGILVYVIAPWFLGLLYGNSSGWSGGCSAGTFTPPNP